MPNVKPGAGSGSWVWHPVDLPEGYQAVPRGQAWQARPVVGGAAAPGAPRGRTAPGRRDATRVPACTIVRQQQGITISDMEPGVGARNRARLAVNGRTQ
jgi:hypothetical protein